MKPCGMRDHRSHELPGFRKLHPGYVAMHIFSSVNGVHGQQLEHGMGVRRD